MKSFIWVPKAEMKKILSQKAEEDLFLSVPTEMNLLQKNTLGRISRFHVSKERFDIDFGNSLDRNYFLAGFSRALNYLLKVRPLTFKL